MTIEIPEKSWRSFFEKWSAQPDSRLDIRLQSEGDLRLVAQDVLLRAAVLDETSDACNNTLAVEFGPPETRPEQHLIVDPIRLILRKQSGGDHYNLLEIPAENGVTVISLRPGISPVMLGELGLK